MNSKFIRNWKLVIRNLFLGLIIFIPFIVNAVSQQDSLILLDVPFTAQAPTGNWRDPRQQDACEEASALMAVKWARNEKMESKKMVEKEILAIADFEKKKYKTYGDTSARDTGERILKDYFKFTNFEVKENININDIKEELTKGRVVIIPVNGRELKNPYYTRPGPERHNLLIRSYDATKKEFITNDAGTKRGEKYRYSEKVVKKAMRDYPTGDHLPIKKMIKRMIVVKKEK